MATFFGRKYFRKLEWVSTFEKALGVGLLLLVIGIVAAYAVTVQTVKEPLFEMAEDAYQRDVTTHEQKLAAKMLGKLRDVNWQPVDKPVVLGLGKHADQGPADGEVVTDAEATELRAAKARRTAFEAAPSSVDLPALKQDAEAFGAGHVFVRTYQLVQDPTQILSAYVVDAKTPAQAFGLWYARKPTDAERLPIGQNGWLAAGEGRCGYWNSRYYTEVRVELSADDPRQAAINTARSLADYQLSVGRPFAEERLLTRAIEPDTLRYVHAGLFDVLSLSKVFVAELKNGDTAFVMDAGSASNAQSLVASIREEVMSAKAGDGGAAGAALPEAAGAGGEFGDVPAGAGGYGEGAADADGAGDAGGYGEESGGYGETGSSESGQDAAAGGSSIVVENELITAMVYRGNTMAVFAAGPYVHGAYGSSPDLVDRTMERAQQLSYVAVATGGAAAPPEEESGTSLPPVGVEGWGEPADTASFTPENLYVKIDGRADAYLSFGVVGMTFGAYVHDSNKERTMDVYWYDMGTAQNALGIFQAEMDTHAPKVDVGKEGYQSGGAIFFRKGGSYVQLLPSVQDDGEVAMTLARAIADTIESDDSDDWALKVMPAKNRDDSSLSFLTDTVFELEFLQNVFTVNYDYDGQRILAFVHQADDAAAAEKLKSQYEAFFSDFGSIVWRSEDTAKRIVAGDVAGVTDVIFVKGRYLAGVAQADDVELAKQAAAWLFDNMNVE